MICKAAFFDLKKSIAYAADAKTYLNQSVSAKSIKD